MHWCAIPLDRVDIAICCSGRIYEFLFFFNGWRFLLWRFWIWEFIVCNHFDQRVVVCYFGLDRHSCRDWKHSIHLLGLSIILYIPCFSNSDRRIIRYLYRAFLSPSRFSHRFPVYSHPFYSDSNAGCFTVSSITLLSKPKY